MASRTRRLPLVPKVTLVTWSVVIVSLALVALFITNGVAPAVRAKLGEQALNIGQTIAQIPEIKANVGKQNGHLVIQPLVEQIRSATGADIIVVFDMHGIRYSHPIPERIGGYLVGGDEARALSGEQYISEAVGTLGPQLRGFVPTYSEGRQVGAVLVSLLIPTVSREVNRLLSQIYVALFLGLSFGLIAAIWFGNNIKNMLFGFEPHELASAFEERDALLESVREGIIAIDGNGRVTLVNDEAKRLLVIHDDIVGHHVEDVVPNTRLPDVLRTGERHYDQEQRLGETVVMTNRVPIRLGKKIIGAVATFRDKTEVKKIAEELTGVRKFVEALRVQNHEFLNKLHTISGLIQLGETEEALNYISQVAETQQSVVGYLSNRIQEPRVLGLLLGKLGRAHELGAELRLSPDSILPADTGCVDTDLAVITLGNLLENALESVIKNPPGSSRIVEVTIHGKEDALTLKVGDSGPGVSEALRNRIFDRGFSTKGAGRGLGLALIREGIELQGGSIHVGTSDIGGALFTVELPCVKEVRS